VKSTVILNEASYISENHTISSNRDSLSVYFPDFNDVDNSNHFNQRTIAAKVAWRFPIQSLGRSERLVDLHVIHVKYALLSDFNQNWNVSISFSKTAQY
jgi:hypothetical protein